MVVLLFEMMFELVNFLLEVIYLVLGVAAAVQLCEITV